jgi:hypothetical protein
MTTRVGNLSSRSSVKQALKGDLSHLQLRLFYKNRIKKMKA